MATKSAKYERLRDFLKASFRPNELKIFLQLRGYSDVVEAVNGKVGKAKYFFDVVQALDRRGRIDTEFFNLLRKERLAKEAQIKSLEAFWLGREDPTGSEPSGTTSNDPRSTNPITHAVGPGVEVAAGMAIVEITINRDFDSYDSQEQAQLLSAIARLLEITGDVRVVAKNRGSVKLALELTHGQAERLLWAVRAGELAELGVVSTEIIGRTSADAEGEREDSTESSSYPSLGDLDERTDTRDASPIKPPPSAARSPRNRQPRVRFIGSRELHRDLPKVLDSLEDPDARFVLTIQSKPRAVIIGAEAFLEILRGASPEDRLLALQLGALVEGLEASGVEGEVEGTQHGEIARSGLKA